MKTGELFAYLDGIVRNRLRMSVMIWGPPGIGKSAIVDQIATKHYLGFIDVRLSQLSPSDLRGLPIADHHDAVSRHYAPEFLPRKGGGILFLDELNMATPALQGVAQQLILDRKIGNYLVPEGWYIWAAGNRKEDRAAVYELTGPVTNRFIHLDVKADLESFLAYALGAGLHPTLTGFLQAYPHFLHKPDPHSPAWPSPRTWMMANTLFACGLDISAAVGDEIGEEFAAFTEGKLSLPKMDLIVAGQGDAEQFPRMQEAADATLSGLLTRSSSASNCFNAMRWLSRRSSPVWVNEYIDRLFRQVRLNGHEDNFRRMVAQDKYLQDWLAVNKKHFDKEALIRTLMHGNRVL
jgi:MoxR-like ATPase